MNDLSRRGARRRGNRKSDPITDGMIVGMTVYPWDSQMLKASRNQHRKNLGNELPMPIPDLCQKIVLFLEALLSLPSGSYTGR